MERDGNNQMFPIAFAVVEGETKESWAWFFKLLLEDIGTEQRWTFMSDQQKVMWFSFKKYAIFLEFTCNYLFCLW